MGHNLDLWYRIRGGGGLSHAMLKLVKNQRTLKTYHNSENYFVFTKSRAKVFFLSNYSLLRVNGLLDYPFHIVFLHNLGQDYMDIQYKNVCTNRWNRYVVIIVVFAFVTMFLPLFFYVVAKYLGFVWIMIFILDGCSFH